MANIDQVGQAVVSVQHKPVITIVNFSCRKATPTSVKKGAFGAIGSAQGIPDVTGSFRFSFPITGPEFDMDTLGKTPGGVTITYTIGAATYMVLGCKWSEEDVSVDQGAGNVEGTANFTGTERIRIS